MEILGQIACGFDPVTERKALRSLDIPAHALKRLLNHKMTNDVTAGYIIVDVEQLRKPMQWITNYILKCAGVKKLLILLQSNQLKRSI